MVENIRNATCISDANYFFQHKNPQDDPIFFGIRMANNEGMAKGS